MRVSMCAGIALLVSTPAFAQDEIARKQAVELAAARVPFEKSIKGAPYSAETIVENSQALADGNRISRKTTGVVYRDGEGRTRREEDVPVRSVVESGSSTGFVTTVRKTISIVDPVGGFSYSLDADKKIAWRTAIGGANAIMGNVESVIVARKMELEKLAAEGKAGPADPAKAATEEMKVRSAAPAPPTARGGGGGRGGAVTPMGAPPTAGARGGGGMRGYATIDTTTPLEHKSMEGVAVEGRKTTTVIPAGQVGNDLPITITSEEWRSTELNVLVLTRHFDPRTGESSYRLQNIVRAEPDHSLFIVPPDYTVRDTGIRRVEPSRH